MAWLFFLWSYRSVWSWYCLNISMSHPKVSSLFFRCFHDDWDLDHSFRSCPKHILFTLLLLLYLWDLGSVFCHGLGVRYPIFQFTVPGSCHSLCYVTGPSSLLLFLTHSSRIAVHRYCRISRNIRRVFILSEIAAQKCRSRLISETLRRLPATRQRHAISK